MAFVLPFLAQGIPWLVQEISQAFDPSQPQDSTTIDDGYGDDTQVDQDNTDYQDDVGDYLG